MVPDCTGSRSHICPPKISRLSPETRPIHSEQLPFQNEILLFEFTELQVFNALELPRPVPPEQNFPSFSVLGSHGLGDSRQGPLWLGWRH